MTAIPFWLDRADAPPARPPLDAVAEADLVVVGGALAGLWGALQAAEEGKRGVLLEAERIAFGASGCNGGFRAASLTHGIGNGLARWPAELEQLWRMGRANLGAIAMGSTAAGRQRASWPWRRLPTWSDADRRAGRRGAWLRTLERLGLGFDS